MAHVAFAVACFLLSLPAAAAAAAASGAGHEKLRGKTLGLSFARSLQGSQSVQSKSVAVVREYSHKLRVCNAYPYSQSLDVLIGKEKLTGSGALPYQSCEEFASELKANDKIQFKIGEARAGTFAVADLPDHDAVLMLIIYRHDAVSTAVAFESHVFADLVNAQLAVIDAYRGLEKSTIRIQDADDSKSSTGARSEELRFDSVVAVNPGAYEIALEGEDGEAKVTKELNTKNRESYVIIRCGVQAVQGKAYPQELMVFPQQELPERAGAASFVVFLPMLLCVVNALLA